MANGRHIDSSAALARRDGRCDGGWSPSVQAVDTKLYPNMLRRKLFAVRVGFRRSRRFVVGCMATAAPRCRTPSLGCSNERLNSLLDVLASRDGFP